VETGEGPRRTGGLRGQAEADAHGVGGNVSGSERRVGVFVDYWWVYSSARQVFGAPGGPPPTWFGNVAPMSVARLLVKSAPASVRRSQRVPGGVRIFVRHYDPGVHRGQHERVQRWQADGASVDVGPSREDGGGFWQGSVNVALACAVVQALERGEIDTAVVFAGDPALLPLFSRLAGGADRSPNLELATWVAPDGSVPTVLASVPGVWCHRLGEATFRHVNDDRRPARTSRGAARHGQAPSRKPSGPPHTAMAAAFVAAGVTPREASARGGAGGSLHPAPAGASAAGARAEQDGAGSPGVVRRLAQRLLGRGD
jgi:hypothetical protein